MRIAIIGAALSANKGAAAMLETVIARQPEHSGPCRFDVLTTYPGPDARLVPGGADVRIVGLEPWRLAIVEIPLALVVLVVRAMRLPTGWVRARACRAILDADVTVDVAGISFADGRGIPITVYNALMTGLPLLLGSPTVKAAQALGPFGNPVNRLLARLVLPRLAAICARGERTKGHLDTLGLANVVGVADLAFSLEDTDGLPPAVTAALAGAGEGYAVVMPSAVVRRLVEAGGIDYVGAVEAVVRGIRERCGLGVVIAPHSYRPGAAEGRMNDGPVCREVAARFAGDPGVVGLDLDLRAGELRRIIAASGVLVTSRFHAMVSGLATAVPTVVVGWSHKYKEVLDDFGLARCGMDSSVLATPSVVVDAVADCLARRGEITAQIGEALPGVRARSRRNFEVIAGAAR